MVLQDYIFINYKTQIEKKQNGLSIILTLNPVYNLAIMVKYL